MQNLKTIKNRGQETMTNLMERTRQQPNSVKTVGVTAVTALGGAFVLSTVAKGVSTIVGVLTSPLIAVTVGAIGGGVLGWNYMKKQAQSNRGEEISETVVPDNGAYEADTLEADSMSSSDSGEVISEVEDASEESGSESG